MIGDSVAKKEAVIILEKYADGEVDHYKLKKARKAVYKEINPSWDWEEDRIFRFEASSPPLAWIATWRGSDEAVYSIINLYSKSKDINKEIFENIHSPQIVDPNWLTWNDNTIHRIAQNIYDTQNYESTPILADALEDAGCTNQKILDHLRADNTHYRGCWVIDLLLGKL